MGPSPRTVCSHDCCAGNFNRDKKPKRWHYHLYMHPNNVLPQCTYLDSCTTFLARSRTPNPVFANPHCHRKSIKQSHRSPSFAEAPEQSQ
ncbi:hypothetical protein RSOLAG1IB_02984 [Rhizoctonia solani AG-1 IB]|uniref:Uncharacterized protein n=1 Tax=Thanatephorus cucumeris (strain AG1-IB / isolate 7/3/14) TaxID=1108050 RepID=A0A0B7FPS6_THACB|nr:hypothetical protein RSOLAG1IB_02984 [Rhizoctonia solani AG-1 IB]